MHGLGSAKYWFAMHMTLGILGPAVHPRALALPGGVGQCRGRPGQHVPRRRQRHHRRFIYTKIHHGLYGRRASLQEMRMRSGSARGKWQSKLAFAPKVEETLSRFEAEALKAHANPLAGACAFVTPLAA